MESLCASAGWRRWLEVRAHLVGQGVGLYNQALVADQRPGARRIAGRAGWNLLGYEPGDGEQPIRVWALVPAPSQASAQRADAGERREPVPRLVGVYDQDQVVAMGGGHEPFKASPPSGSSQSDVLIRTLAQLIKFSSELGSQVTFEPRTGSMRSFHVPATGEIVIDASPDFPLLARAERLVFELTNVLIDEDPNRRGLRFSNGERDLVAKSVAYCVQRHTALTLARQAITVPPALAEEGASFVLRYAALVDRIARQLEGAMAVGAEVP
jgi:hypothetical protein